MPPLPTQKHWSREDEEEHHRKIGSRWRRCKRKQNYSNLQNGPSTASIRDPSSTIAEEEEEKGDALLKTMWMNDTRLHKEAWQETVVGVAEDAEEDS